ncbi:potassium-transporting ATPase subunit KdpA [Klebsiella variicola subsp. variicola]|nr:potassium-transporting ATPase subunit KdpA [Klebsiella variicola subsp. variicola]
MAAAAALPAGGPVLYSSRCVPQNLLAYQPFTTLEGAHQLLPMGPVASQEAIKLLGTNGGGFFNANSAHPFENPTALTNLVQMLAILPDPGSTVLRLRRGSERSPPGARHPVGNDADLYPLRRRGDVGGNSRQPPPADAGR